MLHLSEVWPKNDSFISLFANAKGRNSSEPVLVDTTHLTSETQRLAEVMMNCYASGIVELSLHGSDFTKEISSAPKTTSLARHQAKASNTVTNLKHEIVRLNDLQRQVLQYLDGNHDQNVLVNNLVEHVESGKLVISELKSISR